MASDINEQFFNEKQLYTGDVLEEDADLDNLAKTGNTPVNESKDPKTARAKARERRRKKRATQIVYWLETKYDVLHQACSELENWKEAPSAGYDFDLLWCDTAIPAERFMKLRPYQKMNHFVGMSSITRKNNLGRNLLRMRKQFPKEYRFFPDTWILPTDLSDFKMQFGGKGKTFIIKPDNGCQGRGIFLIRDVEKVPVDFSATYVAQRYIHKPFLLDGYKFDLRLYVLVLGCDPLRIFLHRRGLVRLASEYYEEPSRRNIETPTMHLTNYAINKNNPDFQENTDPDDAESGHKRSLEAVLLHLRGQGYDVDSLEREIEDLVVKTLIAVQPSLSHFYRSCQPDDTENGMCFEILGFDVMLDQKLQPWLLEVNHAPSFATESELDHLVKHEVLRDSMHLLHLSPEARRQKKREVKLKMEQRSMGTTKRQSAEDRLLTEQELAILRTEWEDENLRGYKRLYPSEAKEKEYMHIHDAAVGIWEMLMGGTSRRPVGLISRQEVEGKDAKGDASEGGGRPSWHKAKSHLDDHKGRHEDAGTTEKRTVEELKEIVDRLSAGLGAASRRPKKEEAPKEVEEEPPPPQTPVIVTQVMAPIPEPPPTLAAPVFDPSQWKQQPSALAQRFEVKVGDVIKVETTLGWEKVVVKAKRNNGKIDIQFKDGEYMRAVLPRIMREANSMQRERTSNSSSNNNHETQPSASSSDPAAPLVAGTPQSHVKSLTKGAASSAPYSHAGQASKIPSLPPTRAAEDAAREDTPEISSGSRSSAKPAECASNITTSSGLQNAPPEWKCASAGDSEAQEKTGSYDRSGRPNSVDQRSEQSTHDSQSTNTPTLPGGRRAHSEAPRSGGVVRSAQLSAHGPLSVGGGRGPAHRGPSPVASVVSPPTALHELHNLHEVRLRQQMHHLISVRQVVTQRQQQFRR